MKVDKNDAPESDIVRPSKPDNSSDTQDRDPVEALATEYSERCRTGECVSIEQYAEQHPDLAAEIRQLFPTIRAMEQLNARRTIEKGFSRDKVLKELGDYRVIAEIARGGMGIVYEAEQRSLGRRVAVKVLPQNALTRERDILRFEREAQTAARLHHSNIVPIFGVGQVDGHHYIVMQLIHGVGLDEVLRETSRLVHGDIPDGSLTARRSNTAQRSALHLLQNELRRDTIINYNDETVVSHSDEGAKNLKPDQINASIATRLLHLQSVVGSEYYRNVARIGLQAAQALQYAHDHDTLHRDVKPGNLLLDVEGCVWMADFGLAKALENDSVTNSGDVVGTLAYVAPERFQGETTERSDIYSLGVTLHEMLTLRRAITGKDRVSVMNQVTNEGLQSPRRTDPNIPKDLETIIMKAAAHDAADRYASAGEMAKDLEALLADRPIQARRLSKVEHVVRWSRRNRPLAAMAAVTVLLLATAFGITLASLVQSERQRLESDSMSKLAVSVLDEFYTQFASGDLRIPLSDDAETADGEIGNAPLPVSKEVAFMLARMLPFYDKFSKQSDDTELVALKSISAMSKIGDIHRRLGDSSQAILSYQEAIRRFDQFATELSESESVRLEFARIHNGLGMALLQEDRHNKNAAKQHRAAIALLRQDGSSNREEFEMARSYYLLHAAENGCKRNDSEHLKEAQRILGELQSHDPSNPKYRFLMARCLLTAESGCKDGGHLTESQLSAIQILEALFSESPINPEYQYELGNTYRSIEWHVHRKHGQLSRTEEQLNHSESRLRRALEVTENLEVRHPNILEYYVLKKRIHSILAAVLQEQNRLTEAAQEYVRAIDFQKRVVNQSNDSCKDQVRLHDAELSYAKLLRKQGKTREARELLNPIANKLENLVIELDAQSDDKLQHYLENTLSKTYLTLAGIEENLGNDHSQQKFLHKANELGSP